MPPKKARKPRKTPALATLESARVDAAERAKKARDAVFRSDCRLGEAMEIVTGLQGADAVLQKTVVFGDDADHRKLLADVRLAMDVAEGLMHTRAAKLAAKKAAIREADEAVSATVQAIFVHPDASFERRKIAAGVLRTLYATWDGDSPHDRYEIYREFLPVVRHVELEDVAARIQAGADLLTEMADRVRLFAYDVALSFKQATTAGDAVHHSFSALLSTQGDSFKIYLHHAVHERASDLPLYERPADEVLYVSSADLFYDGEHVMTYMQNSATPGVVSVVPRAGYKELPVESEGRLLAPESLSPYGTPHQRFLLFLVKAFPYRCMTSGSLAVLLAHDAAPLVSPVYLPLPEAGRPKRAVKW